MKISERARKTAPSPTLAISAKVKQMKAQGIDVVGFGAGEPDFDTPDNIKAAAIQAIEQGFTKYTPSTGIEELKDAIIAKFRQDNGIEYNRKQIVVSIGAKHSLYNAIMAVIDPGDEVIIPAPYWVSYPEMVKLADGVPVFVETSVKDGFKLTAEMVAPRITDRTRAIIINSPGNPTGAVYDPEEVRKIAEMAAEREIYIISDEIYEKLGYAGNRMFSPASVSEKIKKDTITVNGVSKTYSMTGGRIGYLGCDEEIAAAIGRIQDNSTSNPVSFAQKGALEALTGSQDAVKMMLAEFDKRRKYMVKRLNSIVGIQCPNPGGAFYVLPDVSALYKKGINGSDAFAEHLLTTAKVAVVPGSGFGADNTVRLSYATSMANIEKGLDRIEEAAKKLL